jgi:transcriptional regulator with XRE-family HTH domain
MTLHFLEQSVMAKPAALRKTLRSRGHGKLIEILVAAREKAGLTQRDLAARLRRPHSFVGRMEAGERRVDVIEFVEIAKALECDARELFARLVS